MYKTLKWVIIIWTGFCLIGLVHGCMSAASHTDTSSDAAVLGTTIGMTIGFGIWFIIWVVPTSIMGVIALMIKPKGFPVSLDQSVLCRYCGKYSSIQATFCSYCGQSLRYHP
jgi:hypothetical protein